MHAHALMKHPLPTADIFLFNIGKSVDTLSEINYDMLEGIKDGELFTSKYDSQRITVNTPNKVKLYLNLYKLRTSEYIVSLTKTFALEGCLNSRLFENQTFYLTYPIDFPLKINLTRKYNPFFS